MILWNYEINFKKEILALVELQEEFESRMKKHAIDLKKNRINGRPFIIDETLDGQRGRINLWADDNVASMRIIINETSNVVESILKKNSINLKINWEEINKNGYVMQEGVSSFLHSVTNYALKSSMYEFKTEYDNAYNEYMINNSGMGFGIISNSLAAHLIYAAQAAAKEVKDEENAIAAATRVVGNDPMQRMMLNASQKHTTIYLETIEPKIIEGLSLYYSLVLEYIVLGLNVSKDELSLINKEASDNILYDNSRGLTYKEKIVNALKYNPNNGKTVIVAMSSGELDEDFLAYCRYASSYFHEETKTEIVKKLRENLEYIKVFNKPIVNEKNSDIINVASGYYISLGKVEIWGEIISEVYMEFWKKIEGAYKEWKKLFEQSYILECITSAKVTQNAVCDLIASANKVADSTEIKNLFIFKDIIKYPTAINLLKDTQYNCHKDLKNDIGYLEKLLKEVKWVVDTKREQEQKRLEEKQKRMKAVREEIEKKEAELKMLGFAFFGEKAKIKKQLENEIRVLEHKIWCEE